MHWTAAHTSAAILLASLATACADTEHATPPPAHSAAGGAGAAGAGGLPGGGASGGPAGACNGWTDGAYDLDLLPTDQVQPVYGGPGPIPNLPKEGAWRARITVQGTSGTLWFVDGTALTMKPSGQDGCGKPTVWTSTESPPNLILRAETFDALRVPWCGPCLPDLICPHSHQAVTGTVQVHPTSPHLPAILDEPPPRLPWRRVRARFPFPTPQESVTVTSAAPSGVGWSWETDGSLVVWFNAWDEAGAWPVLVHATDAVGNVVDGPLDAVAFAKVPTAVGATFAFDDPTKFAHGPAVKVVVDDKCPKGCAVLAAINTCDPADDPARLDRWLAVRLAIPAGATKVVMMGPDGQETPWPSPVGLPGGIAVNPSLLPAEGATELGISIAAYGQPINGFGGDPGLPKFVDELRVVAVMVK